MFPAQSSLAITPLLPFIKSSTFRHQRWQKIILQAGDIHTATATLLVCSPDPPIVSSCCEKLTLLEKCYSLDTIANDQYGNAITMITSNNNNDVYAIVGAKYHSTSGSAYLLSYEKTTNQWEHVAEFIPGGASANRGTAHPTINSDRT